MSNVRYRIAAAAASVFLASCGGHGTSPIPQAAQIARLNFTMHWPAASGPSVRHRHFISPSTMSVVVEVNNDASLTSIANNPSAGQPATSNVSVNAPPGNDTIAISLYDKTDGNGNELGQATVTQQIVAGQANALSATIDGLVAGVDLQPLPNQPAVAASSDTTGATVYTISGGATATFVATAKDVDGNVIVGPGDPIAYSASAVSSALSVSPVPGHADQFLVGSGAVRVTHPVGIIVHAADGQGGNAQSNYDIATEPLLFVAYLNGGGPAQIAALTLAGARIPLAGTFAGVTDPVSMAFDPDDHRMYVLDGASHQLLAFNVDGTAVAGYTPPAIPAAVSVTYDTNNHELYVAGSDNGVSVFQSDATPVSVIGTWDNNATPTAIASYNTADGTTNQIMVANAGNNTVARYNEDGTDGFSSWQFRSTYDTGMPPAAMATNGDLGNTYIAGTDSSGTETLTAVAAFQGSVINTITTGISGAHSILYDSPDQTVIVANQTSGTINVYDNVFSALLTTISSPSGLSTPIAMGIAY